MREDQVLGYAPKENMISLNGWWQSNNIGARERYNIPKEKPQGQKRILVFGDSFAHGSRVPQEETWPSVLEAKNGDLEVINLGVDGYSMGQSLLRYREIRKKIDYDIVILIFVPVADLWRDINTMRSLGEEDWEGYEVYPRFVLECGKLSLIKSPYKDQSSLEENNSTALSEELKSHLRKYDRFYFISKYETPWLIGNFLTYKLLARAYYIMKMNLLEYETKYGPQKIYSEAMQVSKHIFIAMDEEAKQEEKGFILVFLPDHYALFKINKSRSYRNSWTKMVSSICGSGLYCIDLADGLTQLPACQIDTAYDGSHYGPKMNRKIAELISNHLESGSGKWEVRSRRAESHQSLWFSLELFLNNCGRKSQIP
jgi:hypothetical protein